MRYPRQDGANENGGDADEAEVEVATPLKESGGGVESEAAGFEDFGAEFGEHKPEPGSEDADFVASGFGALEVGVDGGLKSSDAEFCTREVDADDGLASKRELQQDLESDVDQIPICAVNEASNSDANMRDGAKRTENKVEITLGTMEEKGGRRAPRKANESCGASACLSESKEAMAEGGS